MRPDAAVAPGWAVAGDALAGENWRWIGYIGGVPSDAPSTMSSSNAGPVLRLEPLAGPTMTPIAIDPTSRPAGTPWILGRSSMSDLPLQDPEGVVSRSHCAVSFQGRLWFLKDLGSRHGTFINGTKLQAQAMHPLADGDRLRIGPWTMRAAMGESHTTTRFEHTSDDRGGTTGSMVKKLAADALNADIKRRLDLIIQVAGALSGAETESQIAAIALDAVQKGTGFPRAAILRLAGQGERVEVIASITPAGPADAPAVTPAKKGADAFMPARHDTKFSLSLLQAASEGQTVLLNSNDRPNFGASIMSLEISAAVCSPIMIDGQPDAYLYVDARGREARLDPVAGISDELAAFCDTIARLVGLAFANRYRKRLEKDEQRQKLELEAAREVQVLIMPPSSGELAGPSGTLTYEIVSIPGRFVAGDLFDFFPIDEHRAAFLLGDVAGKGIAAGLVMANVQGQLKGLLRHTGDPAIALREVNRAVADYSGRASQSFAAIFLSLWCGVFDLKTRTLRFVDAGHGHWLVRPPGDGVPVVKHECHGALPIGVDATLDVQNEVIELPQGFRLYLYSDGVVEQLSRDNQQFGLERTIRALGDRRAAADEVAALVDAVRSHAGHLELPGEDHAFADDFTVAVVEVK